MPSAVEVLFPARPLGFSNTVADIAALRALDPTAASDATNVLVPLFGWYTWDPASLADDDGSTVIKPDDRTSLQAGRWESASGDANRIGLFEDASDLLIAVGTDIVQTSGYSVAGKGGARYAYDEAVNEAYVAANPHTSFISANGRGFRLAEYRVTPEMFGAIGDGHLAVPTDDTVAVKAWARDGRTFGRSRVYDGRSGGEYAVSETVYFVYEQMDGNQPPITIIAPRIRVLPLSRLPGGVPLEYAVEIAGPRQVWLGRLEVQPSGVLEYATAYPNRRYFYGVRIRCASHSTFGDFYIDDTKSHLVMVDSTESSGFTVDGVAFVNSNCIGIRMGQVYGRFFGSTWQSSANYGQRFPITAITQGSQSAGVFTAGLVGATTTQASRVEITDGVTGSITSLTTNIRVNDLVRGRHELKNSGTNPHGGITFDAAARKFTIATGDPQTVHGLRVGNKYTPDSGANANTQFTITGFSGQDVFVTPAPLDDASSTTVILNGAWIFREVLFIESATSILLYPYLPDNVNSQLHLIAGAALYIAGGDTAEMTVASIKTIVSPIALWHRALYGPTVGHLDVDFGEIWLRLAYGNGSPSTLGFEIQGGHAEACQLTLFSQSRSSTGSIVVNSAFSFDGVRGFGPEADRFTQSMPNYPIGQITFAFAGALIDAPDQVGWEGQSHNNFTLSNHPLKRQHFISANSPTLTVAADENLATRVAKHHWMLGHWSGTGGLASPAGNVATFNLSTTLNHKGWVFEGSMMSGATGTLTSAGRKVMVFFELKNATKKVAATVFTERLLLKGSKTYDAPSIAAAASTSTTVTVTGAALGDLATATLAISPAGLMLDAQVTAADTVTVTLFNPTGGAVDLASTTLNAWVEKA